MSLEPVFMPTDQTRPRINVHPEPQAEATRPRKSFQKATLGDRPDTPMSFDMLVDVINPLQHIPGVGHLYRALSGDALSKEANLLGGALFGGPLGMAAAALSALVQQESGAEPAQHAVALMNGTSAPRPEPETSAATAPAALAQMAARPMITPSFTPLPLTETETETNKAEHVNSDMQPVAEAPVLPPQSDEEKNTNELILELFGDGLATLGGEYRKIQQMSQIASLRRDLIA